MLLRLFRLRGQFHRVPRSSFPAWRCSSSSPLTTLLLHLNPNFAISSGLRRPWASSSRPCRVDGIPLPAGPRRLLHRPLARDGLPLSTLPAGARAAGASRSPGYEPSWFGLCCRSPRPAGQRAGRNTGRGMPGGRRAGTPPQAQLSGGARRRAAHR